MARRSKNSAGDELAMGCLVTLLLLPIYGLFLIGSKDPTKKAIGTVLMVVGVIIWFCMSV